MKQRSFASLSFESKKKPTRREKFLGEMDKVVPWTTLLGLIEPSYPTSGRRGRPPMPAVTMLRIHFMQQWYALSDPAKDVDQQARLAWHRVREGYKAESLAIGNRLRGLLAEFGIVVAKSDRALRRTLTELDQRAALPGEFRELIRSLAAHWAQVHTAIDACDARIDAHARADQRCVRLRAIVGIGPITADAAIATLGSAKDFRNGRQLAAWLGLVPTQSSSGGHARLGAISCRGDAYLRTLLIQGARSSLQRAKAVSVEKSMPEQIWIRQLDGRMPFGKVLVAIANKHARQLWAMLAHDLDYDPHASLRHSMGQRPAGKQTITVATMA